MTAQLGQVEHGEGAARCVHRVVRLTGSVVEFVTRCDGRAEFGTPATTVALREQFRRKLVRFEASAGESIARFVSAERLARRSESDAQRGARLERERSARADDFEQRARHYLAGLSAFWRNTYAPRVEALAADTRRGARAATAKARASLLGELNALFCLGSARAARRPASAEKPPRPWFVDALSLASWPCDAQAIKRAFAARALATHPDHGGTSAAFIEVKRARDEALRAAEVRAGL